MKLSLMWVREHLEMPGTHDSILDHTDEIVARLIRSTAEIEQVEHLTVDLSSFFLGKCTTITAEKAIMRIPELNRDIELPLRPSLQATGTHQWYLIFEEAPHQHRYATHDDISYEKHHHESGSVTGKDTVLPPFFIPDHEGTGSWKRQCESCDVRITIDNKSINHRPDLWSHYGMAREIAALMGWKLKPQPTVALAQHEKTADLIHVTTPTCDRFARLDLTVSPRGSLPWMALRLMRVQQRPISALIDLTNYVMFDIGQPLHVFDKNNVHGPLVVRQAHKGEKLVLLDSTSLSLQPSDCVVADEHGPLSLAGIKGGKQSGVSDHTTSLILESAHFAPQAIRQSSSTHRIRTEGSTRWEKGLDCTNVMRGVQRFVWLAEKNELISPQPYAVALWENNSTSHETIIQLSHTHLERKIGITVTENNVYSALTALGFGVRAQGADREFGYAITVPSWRSNDITISEDIIEEIARMHGYDRLPAHVPTCNSTVFDTHTVYRNRSMHHHLAYGLRMQEIKSYPFFDEEFLRTTQLTITNAPTVKNPVSAQWQRLVTSLIPHLVRAAASNTPEEDELRLFEANRTWDLSKGSLREQRRIAWIWYSKKELDFYAGKQLVTSLLDMLRVPCTWELAPATIKPWWQAPATALLQHNNHVIGYAGLLDPAFLNRVVEGSCYGVELDAEYLVQYRPPRTRYEPPSKYPSIVTDISMLASYATTAEAIMQHVARQDPHVRMVNLIDMFEKAAWHDKRSLTLRIVCGSTERTMTHDETQIIINHIVQSLQTTFGVEIR